MLPKKHPSGSEKRKKRKREDELRKSQQGALNRFLIQRVDVDSHDNLNQLNENLENQNHEEHNENHEEQNDKIDDLSDPIDLPKIDDSSNPIDMPNASTLENLAIDVDLDDLFSELKLQSTLPTELMSATEILEFVKSADCYPNVSIAYRILLTVPVTVASAERSFSKLKLIKTYLRSSMSQERLNGLATLSIEKNMLETIDADVIINDFASANARRSHLL